jgi:polar amino acid transport system substrate-binding protein
VADIIPADPRAADLVRSGEIRIALFLPQYARDAASGALRGVGAGFLAIEIGRVLAERLGIAMAVMELPTPSKTVECLKARACDVAFLGIEPSRAAAVDFTPPVIQFDYTYLVPPGSPIQNIAEADAPGRRITAVGNHASTMTLRRMVRHAELIQTELPNEAFALLRAGTVDAFALPREQLLDYSLELPGSRVLAESYGINRVAMAIPKGQSDRLAFFSDFVEEVKASGLVAHIIARGALRGFEVAPPELASRA